jgi:hypothetical protein
MISDTEQQSNNLYAYHSVNLLRDAFWRSYLVPSHYGRAMT